MASITVQPELLLERILSLEIVRVTERAAVSSARLRGHGKEKASDQAAVDAMRRELNKLPIDGTVVIGEGEMDEAPMLFIGERVGTKAGPKVDIAVDPLEGTTLCAKNMPGAIATLAMADAGTLLHAPDCYMDKIAIGPGYPKGTIDLDAPAEENIRNLAKAKGVKPSEITAILLDRPRHADIIAAIRKTGAAVSLISDGDVAGVIHCAEPKTGGGSTVHRRANADAANHRHRGIARTHGQDGYQGSEKEISNRGHGEGRLSLCRHRRHDGRHAQRGQIRQGRNRDRNRRNALRHWHCASGDG
jgi:fructose-1,6-bisphosphatase II / sedoheptulose-1,7-bisphosphatase